MSNERWNDLKKIADIAMKDRKVFMIKGGGFPAVRRALLERGWIEKYESHKVSVNVVGPELGVCLSFVWFAHPTFIYHL